MSFSDRQYKYKVISIDLTTVRADTAESLLKKINTLTILTLDGGTLSMRLNSNTDDLIPCSAGLKIEGIPVTEMYWTNAAQVGKTAKIFVVWID